MNAPGEPDSPNFTALELRCKCSHCNRQEPNQIDPEALAALQRVRDRLNVPLNLTSAYRCRRHPAEAAKPTPGRHNQGLAFDISVTWGPKRMRLIQIALEEGFRGFGFAQTFLHIDYRPEALTSWDYK